MKKLMLVLALFLLTTSGAFAANVAPNAYPSCYQGYGASDPLYNGTNGDGSDFKGWCIDDFGVLIPKNNLTKDSTHPNSQGGMASPVYSYNVGNNPGGVSQPASTYDALIAQQTGAYIVDYGGYSQTPTIDTLSGTGGHYVLPPAYPGIKISISSASKSVITVDTLGSAFATTEGLIYAVADTIEFSPAGVGMTAGQNLKSPGYAGDSITLYCAVQGQWQVDSMQGATTVATSDALWTVISTP